MRPIQERAIGPILEGTRDVILAAATASGKTEAAFLPACSRVHQTSAPGIRLLYVAPLKALINDQFGRAEDLCEGLNISVHRWHGDVAAAKKRTVLDAPNGVLLITPESLEAMFVNHGSKIGRVMQGLAYVVVDELHAFIGSERGRQLQSILCRIEHAIGRTVPRIALSATLGDMGVAQRVLRPDAWDSVVLVTDDGEAADVKLQMKGYRTSPPSTAAVDEADEIRGEDEHAVAAHIFKALRGKKNLVFANAKSDVEQYADLLRRKSDDARVPNEFFAHHGNLAKDLREDAEARLQDASRPCTIVCTSTLEMGIDIGTVSSVAQIGAPFSVAATRQRLGRSGRRDEPAVLRFYVREEELTPETPSYESLRVQLFQTFAIVRLMLQRWCEPPIEGRLHLSTMVQQILSTIAQHGGTTARALYALLCADGPFRDVTKSQLAMLLRHLAQQDIVAQMHDGSIVLGLTGERIVNHYTFFAAFQSPEEFRLIAEGRVLGSLPVTTAVLPGTFLVFGGRRWKVVDVDLASKTIDLVAAHGKTLPTVTSSAGFIHDRVREEMRRAYQDFDVPAFLDARAVDLLREGRQTFVQLALADTSIVACGKEVALFPWAGDVVMNTLTVALAHNGLPTELSMGRLALLVEARREVVVDVIQSMASATPPSPLALAATVKTKQREKYDHLLPPELLDAEYARRELDVPGAWRVLRRFAEEARD